jgi:hypothetical protein
MIERKWNMIDSSSLLLYQILGLSISAFIMLAKIDGMRPYERVLLGGVDL